MVHHPRHTCFNASNADVVPCLDGKYETTVARFGEETKDRPTIAGYWRMVYVQFTPFAGGWQCPGARIERWFPPGGGEGVVELPERSAGAEVLMGDGAAGALTTHVVFI